MRSLPIRLFLHDYDRSSSVYPLVEKLCWVTVSEVGETDAAGGRWILWNTTESVDEDIAGDLHAEGHVGVVVAAGIVLACFVGPRLELAAWCRASSPRADARLKDKARSLPGPKALFGKVDFGALSGPDNLERPADERDFQGVVTLSAFHASPCAREVCHTDKDSSINEGPQFPCGECLFIQSQDSVFLVEAWPPSKSLGSFRHGKKGSLGAQGEINGLKCWSGEAVGD